MVLRLSSQAYLLFAVRQHCGVVLTCSTSPKNNVAEKHTADARTAAPKAQMPKCIWEHALRVHTRYVTRREARDRAVALPPRHRVSTQVTRFGLPAHARGTGVVTRWSRHDYNGRLQLPGQPGARSTPTTPGPMLKSSSSPLARIALAAAGDPPLATTSRPRAAHRASTASRNCVAACA